MMDANFRCRCKDRGLEDVELGSGWSYFVEESKFREHVARAADRKEVSAATVDPGVAIPHN